VNLQRAVHIIIFITSADLPIAPPHIPTFLHPLLTKTQLRDIPYKRAQIVVALESLMENSQIRDIDPTTKRLVDRCFEWRMVCSNIGRQILFNGGVRADPEIARVRSPGQVTVSLLQVFLA